MFKFFGRTRQAPPLAVSIQTRPAEAIGALNMAYYSPLRMRVPQLGTGVPVGAFVQEQGRQSQHVQHVQAQMGLGGLFQGTFAQQPLSDPDYVIRNGGG